MEIFVCQKCKDPKPRGDFGFVNRIRNKRCKACVAAAVRKTYANSPLYRRATKDKNRRTSLLNQIYVFQYLANNPCVDCGEKDPMVLEFDHVDPQQKQQCVTAMYLMNRERIDEEIARCVIRCSNCHNRRTHKDLNSVRFQLSQNGVPADIQHLISTPNPKINRVSYKTKRVTSGQQHPEIECSFCNKMFISTYTKMTKKKQGLEVFCTTKCSNGIKSTRSKKQSIIDALTKNPEKTYRQIGAELGITDVHVGTIARRYLNIRKNIRGNLAA